MARMKCAHSECPNTFEAHRWGKIRAQALGWFLQRDGKVWCPDHAPDWVEAWRKRQSKEL